ncbi:hypothetical protein PSACC_03705 [Paramicrosporidium saccamoebae]|uniref:DNA-directed RNA polymerase III subunit RPC3 n=1 Tax=Paramicrosporidium saccamoebae TaxID=1246581 RepID=A0A2H9TFH0_9FUNG|nr:hypothetical protein PSACC_03705 [Paramicrosporidium saccamoebae]
MSRVQLHLLKSILRDCFGNVVECVGTVLAVKGALSLPVLVQNAKLPARAVKEALFVLIHHGLVRYRVTGDEDAVTRPVIYCIDVDRVMLRLAYPLFAGLAERRFAAEGFKVFLEVAKHGRLSKNLLNEGLDVFDTMVEEGFLEAATPESSIWGEESAGHVNIFGASHSPGKRRVTESPVKDAKRAKIDVVHFVRINVKTFVTALWHETMVDFVGNRINDAAALVMQSCLKCAGNGATFSSFQVSTKLPSGTPLLVDNPGRVGDKSPLSQYLDCLSQEIAFFNKIDSRAGGTYSIDLNASANTMRIKNIEAYISARFGEPSTRIFRILQDCKMLEEKTISKIAMMTPKDTRERLYQMLQRGLVHLQEVPKTLDHAPSRTFFLWTIPTPIVFTRMAEMSLKVCINLLERASVERKKSELLILKSERSDVVANPELLNDGERKQLKVLRKVLNRLAHHINCVMSEFLVLEHFK